MLGFKLREARQGTRAPGGAVNSSRGAVMHGTGGLYGGQCYTVATAAVVLLGGSGPPQAGQAPGGQYGWDTACDWACGRWAARRGLIGR